MKPVVVEWLLRQGLPRWLAPDYPLMVGLAAILGAIFVMRLARRDGEDASVQARALLLAYGAALVGGFAFESIRAIPVALATGSMAPVLFAGRAAYGGLIAALLAPAIYLRRRPGAVAAFFDRAVIPMGIAFAFVRVGCFLEGCDYGRPTALRWGVRFPPGSIAARAHAAAGWVPEGAFSLPVHPTELYESLLGLAALGFALPVLLRRRERDGRAFVLWMSVYAVGRFALEFLRADADRGIYAGLSSAQWVSLGILAALAVGVLRHRAQRLAPLVATAAVIVAMLSAHVASAQPPPAPDSSNVLVLKDGTRLTGKVTEIVPGDHASMLFPDGHASTYPWSNVERVEIAPTAAPGVPPPPPATTPAPPPPAGAPPSDSTTSSLRPQRARVLTVRIALAPSIVMARPDVPSGVATELDALYRFHLGDSTRLDLGLEGRELQNVAATEWSLGVPADFVLEVGRRLELIGEIEIHNTWFLWAGSAGSYFTNTNAYGARLAGGLQLALGSHVLLGASPIAFSGVSSETVGVITSFEPRVWFGFDF